MYYTMIVAAPGQNHIYRLKLHSARCTYHIRANEIYSSLTNSPAIICNMDSMSAARLQERQRSFMSGSGLEEQTRRREQFSVDLRKQKRLEQTCKRRRLAASNGQALPDLSDLLQQTFPDLLNPAYSDLEKLRKLRDFLEPSQSPEQVLKAVSVIRIAVTASSSPPVDLAIQAGLASPLLRLIQSGSLDIMREASWAVCNLLSGSHDCTAEILSSGGLQILVSLLETEDALLREHAVWSLGNIAGDCPEYRKMVLEAGALWKIMKIGREQLGENGRIDLLRVIIWAVYCMLSGKSEPAEQLLGLLPDIQAFCALEDVSLRKDLLWILAYLTDTGEKLCAGVMHHDLGKFAIETLQANEASYYMPAVRILGNVVAGDHSLTQMIMELGLLDVLLPLVQCREYSVRKEVQWTLSNVTAGTAEQRQLFISHSIAREALIGFQDPVEAVRLETSWVYHNLVSAGSRAQSLYLFDLGIFPLLKDRFQDDPRLVRNLLVIIYKVLDAGWLQSQLTGSPNNPVTEQFVASECYMALENLMQANVDENSGFALELLDTFFGVEEESNRFD